MTLKQKRFLLEEMWQYLIGRINLPANCKAKLIRPHLSERNLTILTTVPVHFVSEDGWITCWQEGGGLKVIFWVPANVRRIDLETKRLVEEIALGLRNSISRLEIVQIRWKHPGDFLAGRGWPLKNGCSRK